MPVEVPTQPDELTPEWISRALDEGGLPNAEVNRVTSQQIAEGVGFIGQIHRLTLDYGSAPEGAPQSIIAKMPTNDPGGRTMGSMMRLYEREHGFYHRLAADCPVPVPRCFYAGADPDPGNYCLLLEDLSHMEPGDQLRVRTLDETKEMLSMMARIHSGWSDGKADAHNWLPAIDDQSSLVMLSMFEGAHPAAMERYGHLIPSHMHDWAPRFVPHAARWLTDFASQPGTIIHGDFRTDNFMFGREQTPTLLDWQLLSRAPGAYDVYYFLALSADPDAVCENLDSLLDWYIAEYASAGGTPPDRQTLLHQMRGSGMWLFTLGVVTMSLLDPANERGEALFLKAWERGIQVGEHIDLGSVVPQ